MIRRLSTEIRTKYQMDIAIPITSSPGPYIHQAIADKLAEEGVAGRFTYTIYWNELVGDLDCYRLTVEVIWSPTLKN